jgi:hypothetical protein
VIQQLREAFPFDASPRFFIFDRDSIFGSAVVDFIKSMGTKPCRTAYRSPWQNPFAERWILGARRELFEHVVIFGERHAARLAGEYIAYHHEDRCHLGLDKDTPDERPVTSKPSLTSKIIARWAAPSVRVARRSLIGGGFGEKVGAWRAARSQDIRAHLHFAAGQPLLQPGADPLDSVQHRFS